MASGRRHGRRKEALSAVIAERIRDNIVAGKYPVGSRLPPEPRFAEELGVSRSTLREGLKLLERDGLVMRRQRAGTTVCARTVVNHPLQRNYHISDLIEASGRRHGVTDAQINFVSAPADVGAALELEPGGEVVMLARTRTADDTPVVRTIDHFDRRIVDGATAPLLPDIAIYDWLNQHCGVAVTNGVAHLSADLPSSEVAAQLEIDAGEPVFVVRQVDFAEDGRPALHSVEYHVARAFDITIIRNGPFGG